MTIAQAQRADVRIEPFPPERGRKRVLVSGACWGIIEMSMHGCWGSKYHFYQADTQSRRWRPLEEPQAEGQRYGREVTVDGNKMAGRRTIEAGPVLSTDERLLIKARDIIARGLLRDPKIVDAEVAEQRREFRERLDRQHAAIRAADLELAHALIAEHAPGLNDNDREGLARAMADQFAKERAKP